MPTQFGMPEGWDSTSSQAPAPRRRAFRPGDEPPADPAPATALPEPDAGSSDQSARAPGPVAPRIGLGKAIATLAAAVVAGIGGYTLVGGGGVGPLSPVAQAADSTAKVPGSRFEMSGSVNAGPVSVGMSADGAYNGRTDRTEMTMRMELPAAAATALPGGSAPTFSVVSEGAVTYMSSTLFPSAALGGAKWIKLDLSALGGDAFQQAAAMDPRAQLEQLLGASDDARQVGRERVRGVQTTRWSVSVDLDRSLDVLRDRGQGDGAAQLEQMIDELGVDSVPVEVWIDDRNLLRRMAMNMPFEAQGQSGSLQMTIELFDFGSDPQIRIPGPGEVADASALGGALPGFGD